MTRDGAQPFFGWRVMWAAFVLAGFGWGIGFYSPPIFLHAVFQRTGWPLEEVSLAVTVHFLSGAVVVVNLPRLFRRFGIAPIVATGALLAAAGMLGWSLAATHLQLYAAAALTGSGWVTMSAAGISAIIARWFDRRRPVALSMAYNGAGVGGALLAPLWAYLIGWADFTTAAAIVGAVTVTTVWGLAAGFFVQTPESLRQAVDGGRATGTAGLAMQCEIAELPGARLWRHRAFVALVAGMTFGLFAQIGLISHLYSLLVPSLGERGAGLTLGAATAIAVAGRMITAAAMLVDVDRRMMMGLSYLVQLAGSVLFVVFGDSVPWLAILGALLFGLGIGNATSLPPLIAQKEFAVADVLRVVSLMIATSQATASVAPTLFGLVRQWGGGLGTVAPYGLNGEFAALFAVAAVVQATAIACFLAGRGKPVETRERAV